METKINLDDYVTFAGNEDDHMGGYESADTITLSGTKYSNTTIGGGYSLSPGYGAVPNTSVSASSYPYTITSGTGGAGINPWATNGITNTTKIKLDGEGADIEVNGRSLMDMIGKIEQRLNILHPNDELEAEWAELRALGEQYRKLEQHIKDKQATWDRLKAMPPPNID
jgi:glutamate/tyrosine decarboxylase-like PLP-dependent enzyme